MPYVLAESPGVYHNKPTCAGLVGAAKKRGYTVAYLPHAQRAGKRKCRGCYVADPVKALLQQEAAWIKAARESKALALALGAQLRREPT